MCSFDARNGGSTWLPSKVQCGIGMTLTVEAQSAPIPEEIPSELGGSILSVDTTSECTQLKSCL